MPEKQNFYHTALSESRAAAQQQNPSYTPTTIPPARIAENANLSDIFPFEFKANKSPFLLSNAVANEQKAITVIYTEAEVEGKPIRLILDKLTISYQGQYTRVPTTCGTFNKCSKKVPAFEFKPEKEKPISETFMALESTSNWADETEQQYFSTNNSFETKEPVTSGWNVPYSKPEPQKQCSYIPLKCKDYYKKLSSMGVCISLEEEYGNHTCYYYMLPEECNWIDVAMRGGVCNQTCQYVLSISEKVKRRTSFDVAYNSPFNKLYHYLHNAKMIFDLAMALINEATQKNVHQMKESEYITYTFEIAEYNYEDEVEECIMLCDEQWCPECYALSIFLPSKSNEYEIEFREPEATEKIEATPIYLIENQPASQLKYFNNNGQEIKPEKAHEIDAEYDLRYPGKNTLTLKPKSLTKINLKIALEIPPGAMVQITSQSLLASKGINVRGEIIDVGYIGDITIIEHPEIYTCPKPITAQQIFESNEQICLEHNILIPNIYIPEGTKKV
ncbi:hypothetical protein G9A89_011730 [Geosiphon pyriformis]|nr:hypothetical protein G9A89_011730 [Geosiphon pyriformis]